MTFLHMPLIIVVAFLLLTVVVGIFFSRKKINFSAYAVGSKDFSTATLVATVLATTFGGGRFVRTIEEVYTDGLAWIIVTLMFSSGLWIISTLSLRMGPFMQNLSMAETVGNVYGKHARIVTALVGICNSIIIVSGQIIVMNTAINMCIDIDNSYFVSIFTTLLLIFYSTFEGIRAVTFTDVLQFITFSILIPLWAWVVFVNVGQPIPAVVSCLQSYEKFHFYSLCNGDYIKLMRTALLMLSALVAYVDPATMQRVYMCASPGQSKKVFMYATILAYAYLWL